MCSNGWINVADLERIRARGESLSASSQQTEWSGTESELADIRAITTEKQEQEEIGPPLYDYLLHSERVFKVIIVGDPSVGKTAFVQRYVQQRHDPRHRTTVGVDFSLKVLRWSPFHTVKLQLWDIAGQERFAWVTRVYYREAHGCIVMFDLTNRSTFAGAAKWKADLDTKCGSEDGRGIPCLLLANKCDLASSRAVSQSEIEEMSKREGFAAWTDVSAKEDLMVSDAMRYLVEVMLEQEENNSSGSYATALNDSIKLDKEDLLPKEEKKSKSCAC